MPSLVFDQYAERLRRKNASPNTIMLFKRVRQLCEDFLDSHGVEPENASHELFERYFDTLPFAPSTKNVHLRYIQAAYNYAAKLGRLTHNPTIFLEPVNEPTREVRVIPMKELRKIRDSITYDRDWVFFHLLAYAGLRRNEARTLVWDDGRPEGNVIRLEESTLRIIGKGGKLRYVPIHPALAEALVEYHYELGAPALKSTSRWPAAQTIQDMVERFHPVYTPHDYRRTVADSLDRNGVRESVIDSIMGWAPSGTREKFYRRVASPEAQRAILRLYADDPL